MVRLLVIEDVVDFQNLIRQSLNDLCELIFVSSLKEAKNILSQHFFEIVLLDLQLPDGDGREICTQISLEFKGETHIVVLSAEKSLESKLICFQIGIDDYLEKPIDYRELRLRIMAKIKKKEGCEKELRKGPLKLLTESQKLTISCENDKPMSQELTYLEFKLIRYLMRNEEIILSRERIINEVWGESCAVTDRVVDLQIFELRKKLGEYSNLIKTIYGAGYVFKSSS